MPVKHFLQGQSESLGCDRSTRSGRPANASMSRPSSRGCGQFFSQHGLHGHFPPNKFRQSYHYIAFWRQKVLISCLHLHEKKTMETSSCKRHVNNPKTINAQIKRKDSRKIWSRLSSKCKKNAMLQYRGMPWRPLSEHVNLSSKDVRRRQQIRRPQDLLRCRSKLIERFCLARMMPYLQTPEDLSRRTPLPCVLCLSRPLYVVFLL